MMRTQIVKLTRAPISLRAFTSSALRAAEGDTGATRFGGQASSDAFNKREQASEAKFIREREMETLRNIREKLKQQREHLNVLDKHIEELEKDKGGEQNY